MLHDFLTEERTVILDKAKEKSKQGEKGRGSSTAMDQGWGLFYDELTELMRQDEPFASHNELGQHTQQAEKHGEEYLRMGYTLSEVVHSYGIICQAITSHADEQKYQITSREFQQLNLSLDTAIAEAVTEYETVAAEKVDASEIKRLGYLAHELRNCIQNVTITLEMIKAGSVGSQGNTSAVLDRNLLRMTSLIDGALTEVRLRSEPAVDLKRTRIFDLLHEVGVTAGVHAREKSIDLQIQGSNGHEANVDAQLFVSALANLVQNAIKFSKPKSTVRVRVYEKGDRLITEVQDACGGLNHQHPEALFELGAQRDEDRSGIGFGLSIARRAIEQNNGTINVTDRPGEGCTFTIDLPKAE